MPGDAALDHLPDPAYLARVVRDMRAYVRSEPGAYGQLISTAREDPEGMLRSLTALGAVLLDLAAASLRVEPDDLLGRVAAEVEAHAGGAGA